MGPGEDDAFGSQLTGDYGGSVNKAIENIPGLGSVEQQALANQNQELAQVQPKSGMPDFSSAVKADLAKLQDATKKGQDTTQLRYALMGKLMQDCAAKVSEYTPQPGETFLGSWAHRCINTNINSGWNLEATYPSKDAAGIPNGKPSYSYKGVVFGDISGTTVAGAGSGSFTANMSGDGQSQGTWVAYAAGTAYPWTWTCDLKDTPSAATGNCMTVTQAEHCNAAPGALVKSTNPIPDKYKEGIKKLGACYRRAIVLVSPIMWKYMSTLSPQAQTSLQQALFLQ